jgi:hypothetical protein
MSWPQEAIQNVILVIVGQFNPAIFHPRWFAAEGLITDEQAEAAKLELAHPEFTSFSAAVGHAPLSIQVARDRLVAQTEDARVYEVMRDLVAGTLAILHHTPTSKLGINLDAHVPMGSEERWHALGHRLAPKEPWSGVLESPGLAGLSVKGARPDGLTGHVLVRLGPSQRVARGVAILVNDHFEAVGDERDGTNRVRELLTEQWTASRKRAGAIVSSLVGQV